MREANVSPMQSKTPTMVHYQYFHHPHHYLHNPLTTLNVLREKTNYILKLTLEVGTDMRPDALNFIILLCLTQHDFTHKGKVLPLNWLPLSAQASY